MARKPKLKKFTPPKKVSELNQEIRARVVEYEPERKKVHDEFYRDAAEHRKTLVGLGLR